MEFRPPLERTPASSPPPPDQGLDLALRPASFEEFIGQRDVIRNLRVAVKAARMRDEPVDHILLSGPPGLGKTTLAAAIAREMGTGFREISGPRLERPADLAGILTGLRRGDVLFIDEIHRLRMQVEEYLYSAMEDFKLIIMLDQGTRARTVNLDIQPFTLVGATTREGQLSAPFRARFGIHERLDLYDEEDLVRVARRTADLLGIQLEEAAGEMIAARARGTPRMVNRFLRRIRDLAAVEAQGLADVGVVEEALLRIGLDAAGLLPLDRRLLEALARAAPHPVGLKTLAVSVGEEERTIEDVYEPFLIRQGFLAKTPRGRVLTEKGFRALGERSPRDAQDTGTLFSEG